MAMGLWSWVLSCAFFGGHDIELNRAEFFARRMFVESSWVSALSRGVDSMVRGWLDLEVN